MSCDRPTLLVFCDSLSYYGPTGGLPADARRAFSEPGFRQLRRIKAVWDPDNRFRFNVNVTPAQLSCENAA